MSGIVAVLHFFIYSMGLRFLLTVTFTAAAYVLIFGEVENKMKAQSLPGRRKPEPLGLDIQEM